MLATRALSHIVRAEYSDAAAWADRATRAPNAHVHIHLIAALANELAGEGKRASECVKSLRLSNPNYNRADFFRAFQFDDKTTMGIARTALERLGI